MCGGEDAEHGPTRQEEERKTKEKVMDALKEDMQVVNVTEENTEDRACWRRIICSGNP